MIAIQRDNMVERQLLADFIRKVSYDARALGTDVIVAKQSRDEMRRVHEARPTGTTAYNLDVAQKHANNLDARQRRVLSDIDALNAHVATLGTERNCRAMAVAHLLTEDKLRNAWRLLTSHRNPFIQG